MAQHRVRSERMLLITVQVRRHPDLAALHAHIQRGVAAVSAVLGTSLPTAVHITTGMRTTLARSRVTH